MKRIFIVIVCIIVPTLLMAHPGRSERDPFQKKADLHTELIKLNHVQVQALSHLIDSQKAGFLSKNGRMVTDVQTNTILIKDSLEHLKDIRHYLEQVDVSNQQIMIRVRIVSINNNFNKEWGLRYFSTTRAQSEEGASLNMDLPNMLTRPGQFGLTLAKLNKNNLLDLELSALESEGHGRIISSPELITTNQRAAYIEAGDQIPYQEKNSHGSISIAFKKAVLSLKVMPEIIPDNKIILHLTVGHDKASPVLFNGVPVIQTRAIQTDVLANDGETIVLGGIYEETTSNNVERVPLLGRIPVLGALFRSKKKQITSNQLLIFVTPQRI
jgi:type IV pilus assembly protein PilQ